MDKIYQSLIDRSPFGGKQKDQFADLWVPEVRGHMQDGSERSVNISTSQGPQWVGVGQMTPDGYKVLDYNADTGDTKMEYKGMPFTMPMHKSVILPSTQSNPTFGNYIEHGGMTEIDYKALKQSYLNFQKQSSYLEDPSLGLTGGPQDASHPAYTFNPDVMNQMKKNFEASGHSGENVLTLKEFQEGMANKTIDMNKQYLVPMTNERGEVDFELYKALPTEDN